MASDLETPFFQQDDIAAALTPEAEVLPFHKRPDPQLSYEDSLKKFLRLPGEQFPCGVEDNHVIHSGLLEPMGTLFQGGQGWPLRAGVEDLMRRWIKGDG
jgi:hypothetical protein